jgi:NAD(P)-dependent dehydrogenase (short-subunit alcohol dehydrogenase family)
MSNDTALIVGGGPGISASCARLFAKNGMRVGIAARTPDKPVLLKLKDDHRVHLYAADAADPADMDGLFADVVHDLGAPTSTDAFPPSSASRLPRPIRRRRSTRYAMPRTAPTSPASTPRA